MPLRPPDAGRVFHVLDAGVVRVGEIDVAAGEVVDVGRGLGVVRSVLRDEALVVMVDGHAAQGDPVHPRAPLPFAVGDLRGRVVDPLGRPMDGGPAPTSWVDRIAAPRVPSARVPSRWLPTGLPSVDALCPVGTGRAVVLQAPARAHLLLGRVVLGLERPALQLLVLVGIPRAELTRAVDGLAASGALARSVVIASLDVAPPSQHLRALQAATALAVERRGAGEDVIVVLPGIDVLARSAKALARPLGLARDRLAWPHLVGATLAGLTDHAAVGGPGVLSVVGLAALDAPGLVDQVVPWFDDAVVLEEAPGGRALPRVAVEHLPADRGRQPAPLRDEARRLRAALRAAWAERDVARVTRDPELVGRQDAAAAGMTELDLGQERPVPPDALLERVRAALARVEGA